MKHICPICRNDDCKILLTSDNENLARYGFLKSENSLPLATGLSQRVAFCEKCNFAWNTVFEYDKVKYDSDQIIEAGYFSKRYVEYQKASALLLRKLMGFKPDTIVEIGAGAGIFIKEFDAKRKVAIEPSDEAKQIDKTIEVINEYFTDDKFNFQADIVALRQVLEHVKDPVEFLKSIKKSFDRSDKFCLYIEVPNSSLTFKFGRFYDYYYEHCNYFSTKSIYLLAEALNMEIIDLSTAMDGELLSVLMTNEKLTYQHIKDSLEKSTKSILEDLTFKISEKKKVFAWGASGNGVQILNKLAIGKSQIEYVIDSDKNKQGKFVPGTLQKIISPQEATEYNPNVILVFTQFHKTEIGASCSKLFPDAEICFVN